MPAVSPAGSVGASALWRRGVHRTPAPLMAKQGEPINFKTERGLTNKASLVKERGTACGGEIQFIIIKIGRAMLVPTRCRTNETIS